MREKNAKIVCLVPSWTETLLLGGATVVGRTRFCIHPAAQLLNIPVVGGTKNMKLDDILRLQPDLVVMDQEENRLEMAEQLRAAGIEILVSQVVGIESAAAFLQTMSERLGLPKLAEFSERYLRLKRGSVSRKKFLSNCVFEKNSEIPVDGIEYVIWRKPYMVIGAGTFISEIMNTIGVVLSRPEKYPKVSAQELLAKYCLFSTEPFPFADEFAVLTAQGYRGALVDGEKISWYGIRNLEFMERCLE